MKIFCGHWPDEHLFHEIQCRAACLNELITAVGLKASTKGDGMHRLWAILLAVVSMGWAVGADASGDSSCYPDWKVKHTDFSQCSSMALLSPGNDTRVNLLMLLNDRHGAFGVVSKNSYDIPDRRGDAEPFGYPVFALALGPAPQDAQNDKTGDFPWGTICMSNLSGSADFIEALNKAKNIPAAERATLAAVRTTLKPECIETKEARSTVGPAVGLVKSKQGAMFARYLTGAASFYDGDFVAAKQAFDSIRKTESMWLGEAASYMRGRASLNAATSGAFDKYGSISKEGASGSALADAEAGFLGYLEAYPSGQYKASARGLLRRVYWLGQRTEKLLAEYIAQFAQGDASKRHLSFPDLVQEIDIKLLGDLKPEAIRDPMLLAVADLRAMRYYGDSKRTDYEGAPISRDALNAQRPLFAGNTELHDYLLAAHAFYVANDPADVLRLIPADVRDDKSYLGFSRQLLRALAMDAIDSGAARSELLDIVLSANQPFQRGSAELALAMHHERHKGVDNIFAANSVVRDADIREILIRYHMGPAHLRQRYADKSAAAAEQRTALFTLLYKNLTRGFYADFIRDFALLPANGPPKRANDYTSPIYTDIALFRWAGSKDFVCPPLKTVATALSAKPRDPTSLLCLGEFIRLNYLDPSYDGVVEYLDILPDADELGGSPSLFPGKRFSRLDGYRTVIADTSAGPANRAYALYRAINCYAPSGYNDCDETKAPVSQRKAWFQQLKTRFPASPWAKKSQYYW